MDRSELIGQWMTEWEQFGKRMLTFELGHVEEEGARVEATWIMHLTAEIAGTDGETRQFEMRGTQRALYDRSGYDEWLVEPIEYLGFEQTMDGNPYRPEPQQ
jgi:hypothetical protein